MTLSAERPASLDAASGFPFQKPNLPRSSACGCYQVGDRVNWLFRPRGGYGYAITVAAVVERVGSSHVTIRVARRVFGGEWKIETKCVQPRFLSRRKTACEQLGET